MPKHKFTARSADKHVLYQLSVQSPEAEIDFIDRIYKKTFGKRATHFREDFCGTALICCEWVRRRKENVAYGIDLDEPTLEWGRRNNVIPLNGHGADRVHLIRNDVRHVTEPPVHVVGAFNFSYFLFKELHTLVDYFQQVRRSLPPDGMFILDAYGGWEAQEVMEESTKYKGFTYVWDQAEYNPINDHATCHIHFKFPDGSRMRKAFSYDWRLWTLGGVRDALKLAGFKSSDVFWEGTDKDGEGNGVYRNVKQAENCPGWNAYIVALP